MGRLILAILAFVLAIAVLKMIIIAIVLAGLIFRTKATIGLLFLGGFLTLLAAQPLIGLGLLAVIAIAAFIHNGRTYKPEPPTEDAPDQT